MGWGVVLDATGAYKTNDSTDYVTKLKVVDSSWNSDTKTDHQYKRFVHVFVYSEASTGAPRVNAVGDIVHMKNFDCRTYQNSEVKMVSNKSGSEWAVYDGHKGASTKPHSSSGKAANATGSDADTLKSLRDWSENLFKTKSIKTMNWFGRDDEDSNHGNGVLEVKDIDKTAMVLATTSSTVNGATYSRFAFGDDSGKIYFAEYMGASSASKGDVMKLRSVSTVTNGDNRRVVFNTYSTMLNMPKKGRDWNAVEKACKNARVTSQTLESHTFEEMHLDKLNKVQVGLNSYLYTSDGAKSQKPSAKKSATKSVKGYPILDGFDHGENDFLYENNYGFKFSSKRGSAVRKEYASGNYYTFQELSNIKDELDSGKVSMERYQGRKFLVRGFILATDYDHLNGTAKLYSPSHNRVWDLDHYDQASKTAKDLQTILHNVFYMKDQSIESEQRCFPVYLITFDGNPQYIFDLWKMLPDHKDVKKWLKMDDSKVHKFGTMMENLKAPQYFYDMVLQLMVNAQGKSYFRVCDTLFWFQN